LTSILVDLLCDLFTTLFIQIDHRNFCAILGEKASRGAAYPRCSTGDEDSFAG
jgi:hypothetical protein